MTHICVNENEFENVVSKMATIFLGLSSFCIKMRDTMGIVNIMQKSASLFRI